MSRGRNERREVREALKTLLEVVRKGRLAQKDRWDAVDEHTRLTAEELNIVRDALTACSTVPETLRLLAESLERPSTAEATFKDDMERRRADLPVLAAEVKAALKKRGLRLNGDHWKDRRAQTPVSARVTVPKRFWRSDGKPYFEVTVYGAGGAMLAWEVLRDAYEIGDSPTVREMEDASKGLDTDHGVVSFTILGRKLPKS